MEIDHHKHVHPISMPFLILWWIHLAIGESGLRMGKVLTGIRVNGTIRKILKIHSFSLCHFFLSFPYQCHWSRWIPFFVLNHVPMSILVILAITPLIVDMEKLLDSCYFLSSGFSQTNFCQERESFTLYAMLSHRECV